MAITIQDHLIGTGPNWTNSQLIDELEEVFASAGYHSGPVAYGVPTYIQYPGASADTGISGKSYPDSYLNRFGGKAASITIVNDRYFDVIKNGTQGYYVKEYWQPTSYDASADTITVAQNEILLTGKKLRWNPGQVSQSNNITGLTLDTDYYVVRVDATTIKLATSRANAVAPSPITVDLGGTGTPTNGWSSATRFYTPETSESENPRIVIRQGDDIHWNFPNSDGTEFRVVQQDLFSESYDTSKECLYANYGNINPPSNASSTAYQVQYTSADLVKWEHTGYWSQTENLRTEPISGHEATANAVVGSGFVSSISVTSSGYGYLQSEPPAITFSGGGGSGARATCTVSAQGTISGFTIVSGGSGYTSSPTVHIHAGDQLVPLSSFDKPARFSKGCRSINYHSTEDAGSYDWYETRKYYYTNNTLPNLKGEILLLPKLSSNYTTDLSPSWYVKVPGTDVGLLSPDNDLYIRVSRRSYSEYSGSYSQGKIYKAEICNIASAASSLGNGWTSGMSFTIKGSKTGGVDGTPSGTNGDQGGQDMIFGTNTAASAGSYTSDGIASIHVTDFGGAANNKFYLKGDTWAVLKREHQSGKTRGTTYYTFSIMKDGNNSQGKDWRMYVDSGVYYEVMNAQGIHTSTISPSYSQTTDGQYKELGFFWGVKGEERQLTHNKISTDSGNYYYNNYMQFTEQTEPNTYALKIRRYQVPASSNQDQEFHMFQFVQTKGTDDISYGSFILNGGSTFGNPNPGFDLDELYHGSITNILTDSTDNASSNNPSSISFVIEALGYNASSAGSEQSPVRDPKTNYCKTRESMYGYLRNKNAAESGIGCNYTSNIAFSQSMEYNVNSPGNGHKIYFRDNTYDGSLSATTNYYKPISGIPICNALVPCPYYLPDDYVLIQVGSNPGSTEYRVGDTVTVSAGVEVYTIIEAQYLNNQTGIDGVASSTTTGILFCARTT